MQEEQADRQGGNDGSTARICTGVWQRKGHKGQSKREDVGGEIKDLFRERVQCGVGQS